MKAQSLRRYEKGIINSGFIIRTIYRPVRGYRNYFVEKVTAISQQRHGYEGFHLSYENVGDTTSTLWERN